MKKKDEIIVGIILPGYEGEQPIQLAVSNQIDKLYAGGCFSFPGDSMTPRGIKFKPDLIISATLIVASSIVVTLWELDQTDGDYYRAVIDLECSKSSVSTVDGMMDKFVINKTLPDRNEKRVEVRL
jgi:hypothetical protein